MLLLFGILLMFGWSVPFGMELFLVVQLKGVKDLINLFIEEHISSIFIGFCQSY